MARRVLHVVDSLSIGGMERVVVNLANALQERGYAQTVCCLRQAGPLGEALNPAVPLIEMNARTRDWGLVRGLRRAAEDGQVELVHGQNVNTWCDVVRAFAGRYPIVQSFHGFLDVQPRWPCRLLGHWLARRTQYLLAVSKPLRDEIAERFRMSTRRIEVIENGIDPQGFTDGRCEPARRKIRETVGNRFCCLTVASLTPAKSPETLIEAALRLPDDVGFIWVGGGPLEGETRRRIKETGLAHRFDLLGPQEDVRPFLWAADLFVLPSKSEALPISVLEAMAAGLPIVATRVGGLPDVVREPETGLLADPCDADGLATCIRQLSDDPPRRQHMGSAARTAVSERFSLDRMVDQYEAIYESPAACSFEYANQR